MSRLPLPGRLTKVDEVEHAFLHTRTAEVLEDLQSTVGINGSSDPESLQNQLAEVAVFRGLYQRDHTGSLWATTSTTFVDLGGSGAGMGPYEAQVRLGGSIAGGSSTRLLVLWGFSFYLQTAAGECESRILMTLPDVSTVALGSPSACRFGKNTVADHTERVFAAVDTVDRAPGLYTLKIQARLTGAGPALTMDSGGDGAWIMAWEVG